MQVIAIKTHKITTKDNDVFKVLDRYITKFSDKSVLAISSKIVSICEGSIIKIGKINKDKLVYQEADYFLPKLKKYNFILAIKESVLVPSAGIDESNGNGYYILWPKNPQETANKIREYLSSKFKIKNVGVIITDSKTTPLRWGTTGVGIAQSGFSALNSLIGKPDIFGHKMKVTKVNVMDGLAASAVVAMGEGAEQTPLAIIEDLPFVKFQPRNPSKKETEALKISIEDDLYSPLLKSVKWRKGGKK